MARPIPDMDQMTAAEVATDDSIIIDDTSAGETKRINVGDLVGLPLVGWTAAGEVHTFVSWDATRRIGVITVPSNATLKYQRGNRYRLTQSTGGTKYGIIVAITTTQLTVHFPSGVTLNNETITNPYYSPLDSPIGFPKEKSLWMLSFEATATTAQNSPTGTLWYNTGSGLLNLGPGSWHVRGRPAFQISSGGTELVTGLSTSSSSASHNKAVIRDYQTGRSVPTLNSHFHEIDIDSTSNQTAYLIFRSPNGHNFDSRGDTSSPHVSSIEAVSNYL